MSLKPTPTQEACYIRRPQRAALAPALGVGNS